MNPVFLAILIAVAAFMIGVVFGPAVDWIF